MPDTNITTYQLLGENIIIMRANKLPCDISTHLLTRTELLFDIAAFARVWYKNSSTEATKCRVCRNSIKSQSYVVRFQDCINLLDEGTHVCDYCISISASMSSMGIRTSFRENGARYNVFMLPDNNYTTGIDGIIFQTNGNRIYLERKIVEYARFTRHCIYDAVSHCSICCLEHSYFTLSVCMDCIRVSPQIVAEINYKKSILLRDFPICDDIQKEILASLVRVVVSAGTLRLLRKINS